MEPKPIAEIVVEENTYSLRLDISIASPDAKSWFERVAPTYGTITPGVHPNQFVFNVLPNYNVKDVAAYLRSLGRTDQEV